MNVTALSSCVIAAGFMPGTAESAWNDVNGARAAS